MRATISGDKAKDLLICNNDACSLKNAGRMRLAAVRMRVISTTKLFSSPTSNAIRENNAIPKIREEVFRKEKIVISYYNENWELKEETFDGYKARIIQHEYDHIEGVLFTDHLSPLKKRLLNKRLQNISKGEIRVDYRMKFPLLKKTR